MTTIVVGSILIRERFKIMHRPLVRDILFYILTTTLVWATFFTGKIELLHSLMFIAIYLVYVVVVVGSGIIYRKNQIIKDQESANGGEKIFAKKGAIMPRDALKRTKKYCIQTNNRKTAAVANGDVVSVAYQRQVSSESKTNRGISLKSLYRSEASDDYEGVVLRRRLMTFFCLKSDDDNANKLNGNNDEKQTLVL